MRNILTYQTAMHSAVSDSAIGAREQPTQGALEIVPRTLVIDARPLPAIIEDFTIHHRHYDIGSVHRIYDEARQVERRRQMRPVQIDKTKIGSIAYSYLAAFLPAQRPRAIDACHFDDIPRPDNGRIAEPTLVQKRSKMHLLEHIEIVIRSASIRPQRHSHPSGESLWDPRKTTAELHIARWIVHQRYTALSHNLEIVISAPYAVCGIRSAIQ